MKNHSRRANRRITRYRTPSTFLVRRAEANKRRPKVLPPGRGRRRSK